MHGQNNKYLPAVDQIRGIAALLILFYHGLSLIAHQLTYAEPLSFDHWLTAKNPISALFIEGHTAVSLFMVLSGFIFTVGTYNKQVIYKLFIYNRFLRTYPLFLVVLVVGVSAYPKNYDFLSFLQTVFFMGNYSGSISAGPFTSLLWTISVEWQFYLIFPFLLLFTNKYGIKYLAGCTLLVIIFRGAAFLQTGEALSISYWTIVGRLDQFLIGMITGVLYVNYFKKNFKNDLVFSVATFSLITSLYLFNKAGGWPIETAIKVFWPTIEAVVWGVFIYGYLSFSRLIPSVLTGALSAVGKISYSVYLLHFLIITLCINNGVIVRFFESNDLHNAVATTIIVVLPLTIIFSTMTYTFIEKPFLDMRCKYKK